jgi:NAD(P)-dependent dehydrogenase (short-subunit alcohol dehydrogenase family)
MGDGVKRVALVTGCGKSTGIGAETARMLARQGVTVVVADVAPSGVANLNEPASDERWRGLPSLVDEIAAQGGTASAVVGDVSQETDARRMVDGAVAAHGRLDILVNNAGAPQGAEFNDIESVPVEAWDSVIAINLRGAFLMSRAAVPAMRANRWGRIVSVSSLAGRTGYARQAAYSASKAGILGMTRSMAHDVARDGITVNAVCPGWIRTSRSINSARRVSSDIEAELQRRAERVPVGRLGLPADVAAVIVFLASGAAGYLTGQAIDVDGGLLMA